MIDTLIGTFESKRYGRSEVYSTRYLRGHRVAIYVKSTSGERLAVASANVVEADLEEGEFCVPVHNLDRKDPQFGRSLLDDLVDSGLFEDTGKTVPSGFVVMPVWRLKDRPSPA